MSNIYERNYPITLSLCDGKGKLSVTGCLDIFMDMATLHQQVFGYGIMDMAREDYFWIVGKTRIKFLRTPVLMEETKVRTWFRTPAKLLSTREYVIEDMNGERLVLGETEWLIMNRATGKLLPIKQFITEGFEFHDERLFEDKIKKVGKDFEPSEYAGDYVVSPTDIDFVGHMNNASYTRAIMSYIPSEALENKEIDTVEIFYNLQCKEKDLLKVFKRDVESGMEFGVFFGDNQNVVLARIGIKEK